MITDVAFKHWAVVELLGHLRIAGLVTEAELFGGKLLRCDIPQADGESYVTQYFGAGSIYRLTPCTEEVARHVATSNTVEPPGLYDLRAELVKQIEKRELTIFEQPAEDLDPDEDDDEPDPDIED